MAEPKPTRQETKLASAILGLCTVCSLVVGLLGILFALIAIGDNDFTGAGVCLAAAALAFGLLAQSMLK